MSQLYIYIQYNNVSCCCASKIKSLLNGNKISRCRSFARSTVYFKYTVTHQISKLSTPIVKARNYLKVILT